MLPAATYEDSRSRLYVGDCRSVLATFPDSCVQCCVTSPPYFGLRDYGVDGQIGLEPDVGDYVAEMVAVFRDLSRVLKNDGALWLNLGDSYASTSKGGGGTASSGLMRDGRSEEGRRKTAAESIRHQMLGGARRFDLSAAGVKPKDLIGVPWRVAFALQADGWYLRSDVIWAKPNPMPESVTDRPTKAHEYVFLLTKAERYFYDADAIREPHSREWWTETVGDEYMTSADGRNDGGKRKGNGDPLGRNARTVWQIASQPYSGSHFATMPPALAERCILAGSRPGDTVLDPFNGAGTTGMVAMQRGRNYIGIELNQDYARLAVERWRDRAAQEAFL